MVRQLEHLNVWSPVAYASLQSTARTYNGVITYKELAELVQAETGAHTRTLMMHWIGSLLESVALEAQARNDAPLTALCVRHDGTIGDGYARAIEVTGGTAAIDLEQRAAEDRLVCYRRYSTDLPADGGQPTLTPQVARRRRSTASRSVSRVQRTGETCPTCSMEIPLTGICDNCS